MVRHSSTLRRVAIDAYLQKRPEATSDAIVFHNLFRNPFGHLHQARASQTVLWPPHVPKRSTIFRPLAHSSLAIIFIAQSPTIIVRAPTHVHT